MPRVAVCLSTFICRRNDKHVLYAVLQQKKKLLHTTRTKLGHMVPYTIKEMCADSEVTSSKASSKEQVLKLCHDAYTFRDATQIPDSLMKHTAQGLSLNHIQTNKLLSALGDLIKTALFQDCSQPAKIAALFPDNFNKDLRNLLGKIILENLGSWRSSSIMTQVSMPQLVDFDWRVDVKAASDTVARMSIPTCILQLKVQNTADEVDKMAPVSNINVELSKETLDTMLDGLGRIRDQLSSVTKR